MSHHLIAARRLSGSGQGATRSDQGSPGRWPLRWPAQFAVRQFDTPRALCVCVRGVAWGRNTLCPTCVRSEVMCCDVCMRVRWQEPRRAGCRPGAVATPTEFTLCREPVCACVDAWALSNKRGLIEPLNGVRHNSKSDSGYSVIRSVEARRLLELGSAASRLGPWGLGPQGWGLATGVWTVVCGPVDQFDCCGEVGGHALTLEPAAHPACPRRAAARGRRA